MAVALAGLFAQPFGVGGGVVPARVDDRAALTAPVFVVGSGSAGGSGKTVVLVEGHLVLADGERLGDFHLVRRLLVFLTDVRPYRLQKPPLEVLYLTSQNPPAPAVVVCFLCAERLKSSHK